MKTLAWRMTTCGVPSVIAPTEIDLPELTPQDVLIRVVAAGFNPIDAKIRSGAALIAPEQGVLGCDVSGYIEAIGSQVTQFAVGDAVFGCAGGVKGCSGAYAHYMVADARLLVKAPESLPLAALAGVPIPAVTASMICERLAVIAGDELFVSGASGAVGQWLVQMAVSAGAIVHGTGGNESRLADIRALGATAYFHLETVNLAASGRLFHKVADTFGGVSLQSALQVAEVGGQVATINARGQHELALMHAKGLSLHAIFMLLPLLRKQGMLPLERALQGIAQRCQQQSLLLPKIEQCAMNEVAEVHARYERGELAHKVVLVTGA